MMKEQELRKMELQEKLSEVFKEMEKKSISNRIKDGIKYKRLRMEKLKKSQ